MRCFIAAGFARESSSAIMQRIRKILVPCDFSEYSDAAIQSATDLAEKFSAQLCLLHVAAPGDRPQRDAREKLSQLLPANLELKLKVQHLLAAGTPHREILRSARQEEADLIVMGTHGRTGLAHLAMGSVAERVLQSAHCPVLVIRNQDREANLPREAAKLLQEEFGAYLPGPQGEGRAQMLGRLARVLELSEPKAEQVLSELESANAVRWSEEHGHWVLPALVRPAPPLELTDEPGGAPLDLLHRAVSVGATDIHIDPTDDGAFRVRFRIDGRLQRYCELDHEVGVRLVHQFKMLGHLDIAEPFRPKEGRLRLNPDWSNGLEARLTTSPVAGGEAIALRLFSRDDVFFPLDRLGLSEQPLNDVRNILHRGEGIVLVTGPTGSGKTTSVYSLLQILGSDDRNIVAIEDPVEFPVAFVRQMEVDYKHGITMTSGLRTMLRMDPDVIFVGEVRDVEAAEISMRAAGSGRYVFSTLHTRDIVSTITAMRDLGIDDRSLAANLTGILSQRLVRRLCPQCRHKRAATAAECEVFEAAHLPRPSELYDAVGCDLCRSTGYRGRTGVFEVVAVGDSLRQAIASGSNEEQLRQALREAGTRSLMTDALQKAATGVTSFAETQEICWL